jgi:uncharacterized protein YceH (UPF0502 family)
MTFGEACAALEGIVLALSELSLELEAKLAAQDAEIAQLRERLQAIEGGATSAPSNPQTCFIW